jgi:hypothetical protein
MVRRRFRAEAASAGAAGPVQKREWRMEDGKDRREVLGQMHDADRVRRGEIPCTPKESCNSKKILAAKERKEPNDNNLRCFFYAIFVLFVVNSSSAASPPFSVFEAFWCNSIEMPFLEPLMNHLSTQAGFANQGNSR